MSNEREAAREELSRQRRSLESFCDGPFDPEISLWLDRVLSMEGACSTST